MMSTLKKVTPLLPVLALALAFALGGAGCANDASCSPDERFENGLCLPRGSGQKPATPEDDAGRGDGRARVGEFGADCIVNADCGEPAPVCAIQPTDAVGFCSAIDCSANPGTCPSGWECFDPSVINPDYPTICVPSP